MNEDLVAQIDHLLAQALPDEQTKLLEIQTFLAEFTGDLRGRRNPEVQLSASGVAFREEKMFFIEHPYQKEWLLPAGHVEVGESPLQTALREFHEETGYFAECGKLIDVNWIDIPYNEIKQEKAHRHVDFRYLLEVADKCPEHAELPVILLDKAAAPVEFKKYFDFQEEGK